MYNLLLVDDEPWILKDMEQIIDWEEQGFRLIASVSGADAAEAILRRQRIDVVISDIRMPGKSGLDLLRSARRIARDTLVVFMSAYSDFAYAKQALEQGCFSYLLKPVSETELLDTLARCKERLGERERELIDRREADQAMRFLEGIGKDQSIRRLMDGLARQDTALKSSQPYALFASVRAEATLEPEGLPPLDELLASSELSSYRSRVSASRWCYLVGLSQTPDGRAVARLYRRLCRLARQQGWDIGLSAVSPVTARSGKSYHQAAMLADTSQLTGRHGVHRYKPGINRAVPALRERIIKADRPEQLKALLIEIRRGLAGGTIHYSGLAELHHLFIVAVDRLLQPELAGGSDSAASQELLMHYGDAGELLEDMASHLETRSRRRDEEPAAQLIVEEVVREVDLMFAHRISLKELARKHYISPNYLSHLFKQEKGQSFIHYLIHRRLQAARMLLEQEISLYEVARMVGYDDYAHFSKLFKKHLGHSPLDYKNHIKRQQQFVQDDMAQDPQDEHN